MKLTLTILSLFAGFNLHAKDASPIIVTTPKGDKITMDGQKDRPVHIANKNVNTTIMDGGQLPIALNGKTLFNIKEHREEFQTIADNKIWVDDYLSLRDDIDAAIASEKEKLPPGYYDFEVKNQVVNEKGDVVYYRTGELTRHIVDKDGKMVLAAIPKNEALIIEGKIKKVVEHYRYTPFVYNCKVTPYLSAYDHLFDVKKEKMFSETQEQQILNQMFNRMKKGKASK